MCKEPGGISSVKCPICNKELKLITMTHLKVHNYKCKEDFLKDYPNTQLVSKNYEEQNRVLRRRVFTELNKSPEQRAKASAHAKKLNQDYYHQSNAGKSGWTKERRKEKSDLLKSITWNLNNLPEYEDYRKRRQQGFSYGKRIPYELITGEIIYLRSFLECKVCKFLELNNYNFVYEKVQIPYNFENKTRNYFPDFYLEDYNLCLEVKPFEKQNDEVVVLKKNATIEQGYNFLFVNENNLKDYKNLINKINALGTK